MTSVRTLILSTNSYQLPTAYFDSLPADSGHFLDWVTAPKAPASLAWHVYDPGTPPEMSDPKSDTDGSSDPPESKFLGSSMDGAPYWTPAEVDMSKTKLAANDTYRQALLYFSATHSPVLHQNFQGPLVLTEHVDPY